MADVRTLLRNERNARRISHPHATYSTTGTLICSVCHIQLKSESLWSAHLRSSQHAMRLQQIPDGTLGRPPGASLPESQQQDRNEEDDADSSEPVDGIDGQANGAYVAKSNKRKADDGEEPIRKRSKADGLPEGLFDGRPDDQEVAVLQTNGTPPNPGQEIQLPSRSATPLKAPESKVPLKAPVIDEDEWAAFEADIAAVEAPIVEDAIISAPAMSVAEVAARLKEEEIAQRKERQEAELEGDKEDAARKLEDEFEEMEALEERVRKLKEKREALRIKDPSANAPISSASSELVAPKLNTLGVNGSVEGGREEEQEDEDDDEDDDDNDDDWDGFRLKT